MRAGWRRTNAVRPWPGCPTSGNVIPTMGPMRSHGSRRSCRRGAGTAAGRTLGPVPVSGLPRLLTQFTAKPVIPALPRSGAARYYATIHAGPARRNAQPGWVVPGEALFPSRLPQRRVTFSLPSSSLTMRAEGGCAARHGRRCRGSLPDRCRRPPRGESSWRILPPGPPRPGWSARPGAAQRFPTGQ